jgi:hypothetical protein
MGLILVCDEEWFYFADKLAKFTANANQDGE